MKPGDTVWLKTAVWELILDDGLCVGFRRIALHRAENYSNPLTVNDIESRLIGELM